LTRPPQHEITQLLAEWRDGNQSALDELYPLVYDELHRLARRYMSRERKGHTLQTTALINEAYVRLVDQKNVHWANRSHFFAISAQIMRRILIDHARRHGYAKRGGGAQQVSLEEVAAITPNPSRELVRLDEALKSLSDLIDALRAGGAFDRAAIAVHLQAWRLLTITTPGEAARGEILSGLRAVVARYGA